MDLELICLLVSELYGLCVSGFLLIVSWETQVWLHTKTEILTSAHAVRSWGFRKSRNYQATCNKTTRVGNTEWVAPLTPGELHRGWLSPTSCLKSTYLGEDLLSCFFLQWKTAFAASKGWAKPMELIAKTQILLFSAVNGKLQAQHSFCYWKKKKLFSYVVCAVWLKKRPHSLWLLWTSGW